MPVRVALAIVIVAAAIVSGFGFTVAKTPALYVSSMAVLGVGLVALGLVAASASVRAARAGEVAKAVAGSLFGGLCELGGFGCIAVAVVLGLLVTG